MSPDPKKFSFRRVILGANALSLGISIVVAIVLGAGLGLWLSRIFHTKFFIFFGIFLGSSAAIMNVYKVFLRQKKDLDELARDPKYAKKSSK